MTTGWKELPNGAAGDTNSLKTFPGVAQASLRAPASVVAFADASQIAEVSDPNIYDGCAAPCVDPNNAADLGCGPFIMEPDKWVSNGRSVGWEFNIPGVGGDYCATGENRRRRPHFRHQMKANVVFADGHAKSVGSGTYKARIGSAQDIWHNHD
jgi:prepilin-type processing-associated H-X9-DG protein